MIYHAFKVSESGQNLILLSRNGFILLKKLVDAQDYPKSDDTHSLAVAKFPVLGNALPVSPRRHLELLVAIYELQFLCVCFKGLSFPSLQKKMTTKRQRKMGIILPRVCPTFVLKHSAGCSLGIIRQPGFSSEFCLKQEKTIKPSISLSFFFLTCSDQHSEAGTPKVTRTKRAHAR